MTKTRHNRNQTFKKPATANAVICRWSSHNIRHRR